MGRLMSMSHQKYRILAKTWNPNKTTPKVLEYTIGVNTYLTKKVQAKLQFCIQSTLST